MAVLSDKGLTCSDPLCRQRDFLPFHCSKCEKVFCLEHYLPDAHCCPKKNIGDRRVYVCPACLEVVQLLELETDDGVASRHRPHCRPDLRAQREQKRRGQQCPAKGCKERLSAVSSIRCPHCNMDVCIKHRLKEDHNCGMVKVTGKEPKPKSFMKQLSSSASRAVKTHWHSDSSDSGSDTGEGCACDVAACWRRAENKRQKASVLFLYCDARFISSIQGKRNGFCTIM